MGPTCAACHTGQVKYRGKIIRVDGGPTLGDFTALLDDLVAALRATASDEAKFQRFAAQVARGSQQAIAELRRGLDARLEALTDRIELNLAPSPPGHGRVDAIGNIFNEAFVRVLGIPENKLPPSAPVSYPFIWDTPQHDVVQWNGSAPNAGIGSLLRNIGEVLGVFANVDGDRLALAQGVQIVDQRQEFREARRLVTGSVVAAMAGYLVDADRYRQSRTRQSALPEKLRELSRAHRTGETANGESKRS